MSAHPNCPECHGAGLRSNHGVTDLIPCPCARFVEDSPSLVALLEPPRRNPNGHVHWCLCLECRPLDEGEAS